MRMSIKYKLAILINLLVVALVLLLSVLFYLQFRNALNQRVLLQLSSIKQLKMVQILDYLEQQTEVSHSFLETKLATAMYDSVGNRWVASQSWDSLDPSLIPTFESGQDILDLSHLSPGGNMLLAFGRVTVEGQELVWLDRADKIQEILLERTGMGETGETYLVGSDTTMRSISRFQPERNPSSIKASTEGALDAIAGNEGTGIFPDYRGIMVYSAYGPLDHAGLDWNILSEIDRDEAMIPLRNLRNRLIWIAVIVLVVMGLLSFYLATRLVKPLERMKNLLSEMSLGNFNIEVEKTGGEDEIQDMFEALSNLVASINQAMDFAYDVGQLQLDQEFKPLSDQDVLGKALIQMRDKLRKFNEQEKEHQLQRQKALLQGQEKERARLSRELHDGLGPLLTSLKLLIQRSESQPEEKSRMKSLLDETITEVRRMSYNLMPQALIDFGVGDAITKLVKVIQQSTSIEIKYLNATKDDNTLSTETNVGIYRMAQEILNNSVKHSKATEMRLSLTEFDDHISLYFQDNGCGFDPHTVKEGSGLVNLRERCRILNGDLTIKSDEGGTVIEIEIPIEA